MTDMIQTFTRLREDALRLGLNDLAIAYGWTLMRLNDELLNYRAASAVRWRAGKAQVVGGWE